MMPEQLIPRRAVLQGILATFIAASTKRIGITDVPVETIQEATFLERLRRVDTLDKRRLERFRNVIRLHDGTIMHGSFGSKFTRGQHTRIWVMPPLDMEKRVMVQASLLVDDEGFIISDKPFKDLVPFIPGDQLKVNHSYSNFDYTDLVEYPDPRLGVPIDVSGPCRRIVPHKGTYRVI